mmetsp:Transcript_4337/g.9380  ORF Transcript_4337/g.9380 Transcript_4337/m.9380 type:complete len:335 (-) Transcript_4337:747-1751(-)
MEVVERYCLRLLFCRALPAAWHRTREAGVILGDDRAHEKVVDQRLAPRHKSTLKRPEALIILVQQVRAETDPKLGHHLMAPPTRAEQRGPRVVVRQLGPLVVAPARQLLLKVTPFAREEAHRREVAAVACDVEDVPPELIRMVGCEQVPHRLLVREQQLGRLGIALEATLVELLPRCPCLRHARVAEVGRLHARQGRILYTDNVARSLFRTAAVAPSTRSLPQQRAAGGPAPIWPCRIERCFAGPAWSKRVRGCRGRARGSGFACRRRDEVRVRRRPVGRRTAVAPSTAVRRPLIRGRPATAASRCAGYFVPWRQNERRARLVVALIVPRLVPR